MQLTNPLYFLLSLFIALVILFYFFRKQYEERHVSSNMFWKEVLNEWQASPWLKKLQQNLIFWLQISALLLLMFALVRPFWFEDGLTGDHIVFIIDPSATMSAAAGKASRFEQAKEEMSRLAGKLQGQEVTIIEAGQKPIVLLNHETDKSRVSKAIDSLKLTYEHENIEKAVNLAESFSSDGSTSIHIFSDGVADDHLKNLGEDRYVEVHNFGGTLANLSITSFGVAAGEGKISGVAVIENQSDKAEKALFSVRGAEGKLFEQDVEISHKEPFIMTIPELPGSPFYEASIKVNDGYTVDNKVTAIYTDTNPKVYALGEQNPFMIKGFETIGVDLIQTDSKGRIDDNGILIVEAASLAGLPDKPLIVVNSGQEKQSLKEAPKGIEDPLLEYVHPGSIYFAAASNEMEGGLQTVLKSGDMPLIQKGIRNGKPLIVLNFSLADTDWPLQPGFPIFLYNSYQWLSSQTGFLGYFTPGEKKWLNVGSDSPEWEIYNDGDENIDSIDLKNESFTAPFHPGTYQAVADETISYFSVLLDEREKTTVTAPSFILNKQQVKNNGENKTPNDSLWFLFAGIALILIAAEWEVFRRGFRG
ncbi:vWA domain-containing protein [Bacillus sp. T33-2]|uniref:vWA domain-containing protein n=1 Tax=Bacillus sp. T33-2 TaxID=2054168 RepID=UPI000C761551|nr:BatA and WFA domain-containing protein [Bacillus sp. T33-2]PLR97305.1 hypothetical protein CVD19_07395 [Bacillus sp. T33-2]